MGNTAKKLKRKTILDEVDLVDRVVHLGLVKFSKGIFCTILEL